MFAIKIYLGLVALVLCTISCTSTISLRKQPSDIVYTSLTKSKSDITYTFSSKVKEPFIKTQGAFKMEFPVKSSFENQLKEVITFKYAQNSNSKNKIHVSLDSLELNYDNSTSAKQAWLTGGTTAIVNGKIILTLETQTGATKDSKVIVVPFEKSDEVGSGNSDSMGQVQKIYKEVLDEGISKALIQTSKHLDTIVK